MNRGFILYAHAHTHTIYPSIHPSLHPWSVKTNADKLLALRNDRVKEKEKEKQVLQMRAGRELCVEEMGPNRASRKKTP